MCGYRLSGDLGLVIPYYYLSNSHFQIKVYFLPNRRLFPDKLGFRLVSLSSNEKRGPIMIALCRSAFADGN